MGPLRFTFYLTKSEIHLVSLNGSKADETHALIALRRLNKLHPKSFRVSEISNGA